MGRSSWLNIKTWKIFLCLNQPTGNLEYIVKPSVRGTDLVVQILQGVLKVFRPFCLIVHLFFLPQYLTTMILKVISHLSNWCCVRLGVRRVLILFDLSDDLEMCHKEKPNDVLLARVFSQSVQFLRQVGGGGALKGNFVQLGWCQEDEEDAWRRQIQFFLHILNQNERMLGWSTQLNSTQLHGTSALDQQQQKMTVNCQRPKKLPTPSFHPHSPHVLQVTHSLHHWLSTV